MLPTIAEQMQAAARNEYFEILSPVHEDILKFLIEKGKQGALSVDISAVTGVGTLATSGLMRPLVKNNYVEKIPVIYNLNKYRIDYKGYRYAELNFSKEIENGE